MGEFAYFGSTRVKIGTCEDMYYLRADQVGQVKAARGSVDPGNTEDQKSIRFRFPWPDEDNMAPGAFERYDRSAGLYGVTVPEGVDHYNVQFVAQAGYLLSLPCPEGPSTHGLHIARNGFPGPVKIVQQAYRGGVLALICECGGCGARYRVPSLADAQPIIAALMAEAASRKEGPGSWWHKVADRIEAGYTAKAGHSLSS